MEMTSKVIEEIGARLAWLEDALAGMPIEKASPQSNVQSELCQTYDTPDDAPSTTYSTSSPTTAPPLSG